MTFGYLFEVDGTIKLFPLKATNLNDIQITDFEPQSTNRQCYRISWGVGLEEGCYDFYFLMEGTYHSNAKMPKYLKMNKALMQLNPGFQVLGNVLLVLVDEDDQIQNVEYDLPTLFSLMDVTLESREGCKMTITLGVSNAIYHYNSFLKYSECRKCISNKDLAWLNKYQAFLDALSKRLYANDF